MHETELEDGVVNAEDLKYRNVARAVCAQPWAIRPWVLGVIRDVLDYRSRGVKISREDVQALIFAGREEAAARSGGGSFKGAVAVLPLYGIIAPRASIFAATSSSGTGIDEFTKMFRAAMADDQVGSILIDVDSPGGQVGGVPELAEEIRASRGQGKPIVAIANGVAASAAYWIASQCDELVVTPSGEVGSIGVYAAHEDISEQLAMDGVKVTLISAGQFKTEGNPFEPLSEEAAASIQSDVDAFYAMFTQAVARGRAVALAAVNDGFGQGRMLMAKPAVAEGMADRVATFDETVQRLARGKATSKKAAAALPGSYDVLKLTRLASTNIGLRPDEILEMTEEQFEAISVVPLEARPDAGEAIIESLDDPTVVHLEDDESSPLEFVSGAERLLVHPAVREAFPTGDQT